MIISYNIILSLYCALIFVFAVHMSPLWFQVCEQYRSDKSYCIDPFTDTRSVRISYNAEHDSFSW